VQNRYTGDIGDYFKYGLLRALSPQFRLGVAWFLFPDEHHNKDGGHVEYLNNPKVWRKYDTELFDFLKKTVENKKRFVSSIENSGLLGKAIFSNQILEVDPIWSAKRRALWRKEWFEEIKRNLGNCNLVFADPDNGLCEDNKFSSARKKDWKRLPLSEAIDLGRGRPTILYHHNTRFPGGHEKEINHWGKRLGKKTIALRWRAYGSRTFFIVNYDDKLLRAVKTFAVRWAPKAEFSEIE